MPELHPSPDLTVTNATAVLGGAHEDQYELVPDTAIAITGPSISWIGPTSEAPTGADARTIDAHGALAVPGLISSHNHLFQNLCKGLGDEMGVWQIVTSVILSTAEEMTADEIYAGALAACIEGLHSGRTALFDFHVGLPDIECQRAVVRAFEDSGVRGVLGRATREVYYEAAHRDPWRIPLEEALGQISQLADEYDNGLPTPSAVPAPGTAHTMTLDGLVRIKEYVVEHGSRMTVHLAEYAEERGQGNERWGAPTIAKLEEVGFLGPELVAAHSTVLTPEEMETLARTRTHVSYNPVSNCYTGLGIAPIVALLELGVDVSLAVDGASVNSQNMIESLKFGALLQKVGYGDAQAVNARDMLAMATSAGARSLGAGDLLGALEVGRLADLFLFDHNALNTAPAIDPISALVYMGGPQNVDTVIVGGEVLLEGGRSTRVDEQALAEELRERARAVAGRAGTAKFARGRRRTPFTLFAPQAPHMHIHFEKEAD